jgi:hypothetical protein
MDAPATGTFVAIALILIAGIAVWFVLRHRRSRNLRDRFGPEYDRVVRQEGNVRRGEGVLEFREKRREDLHIRPLSDVDHRSFAMRWNAVQGQFVDDPEGSVEKADQLLNEAMRARGYPVSDFDEQVDLISVDHPVVVENYRAAHALASTRAQGQVTTEGLRKAMVHYRTLFDELLRDSLPARKEA